MKRVVWMAVLLVLALPMAAFASSIDFGNFGGSVSGSASGLTVSSTLMTVTGLSGGPFSGPNLGTVTINTGALSSGTLASGGTFGAGTITITSNGSGGLTAGTLFSGTFNSATWTLEPFTVGGNHEYVLSIGFAGGNGSTFQIAIVTGKGFFNGTGDITSGDTTVVVPEPGSLGLLGTGLVGVAGLVRRKLKCG